MWSFRNYFKYDKESVHYWRRTFGHGPDRKLEENKRGARSGSESDLLRKAGGSLGTVELGGRDKYGENVHGSMYQDLFSNEERLGIPECTFERHLGKEIPSFPPRPALKDYLRGYWKFLGVDEDVLKSHCVRQVNCRDDKFTVKVANLPEDSEFEETFDYLVWRRGIFQFQTCLKLPAWATFPGEFCTPTISGAPKSSPERTCWRWERVTALRTSGCSATSLAPKASPLPTGPSRWVSIGRIPSWNGLWLLK